MHYHYGNHRCQILLCSDGAVDSADSGSMKSGMSRLLQAVRTADMAERLPLIVKMLEQQLAGKQAHDDIALILVDCPAEDSEADSLIPEQPATRQIEIHALNNLTGQEQCMHAAKVEWKFDLALTAPQLRQADIVPMLMQVVNQIEHEGVKEVSGKLFLVMSELFNNALDHGLLKLDSALKNDPLGMDRYFEERTARLNSLEQGKIKIELFKIATAHDSCLKIIISDTGHGFDYQALETTAPDSIMRRHGRGIALVESLSGELHYADNGRESHVCIPLRSPEQCNPLRVQEPLRGKAK